MMPRTLRLGYRRVRKKIEKENVTLRHQQVKAKLFILHEASCACPSMCASASASVRSLTRSRGLRVILRVITVSVAYIGVCLPV